MRPFQQPGRASLRGWTFTIAIAAFCLGLAACSDVTPATTAATSVTPASSLPADTAAVAAIELTDQGFSPDRTEVREGTRLTLRNATDSRQSVVIKGRDFGGSDGDEVTLEPGQTVSLNVRQLGAYILTLADDPQVTASIFIS
jgi:hypothetical protein